MTPRKRPAHAGLERHSQRVAEATSALREAEVEERRATSAVEDARDRVRECHDLGADASDATAALAEAKTAAEDAVLAREGVEQRVRRATLGREHYLAEHGRALLDELAPDCAQAAEDLRARAEDLLAADRRWRELSTAVAAHLRALRLVPHANAPAQHGLEAVLRDLRRALGHKIATPSPHWQEANAARTERETVARLRREREAA